MANFTIFRDEVTGKTAAVYDFLLPTQTGIGRLKRWIPVYHGDALDIFDKEKQRKDYECERGGKYDEQR